MVQDISEQRQAERRTYGDRRRRGRKMKPGRWMMDEHTGKSGYFIGYADDLVVNGKVIIDRDYLSQFPKHIWKERRSFSYRLASWILRSRVV